MAPPKKACCNPSQREGHVKLKRQKGVQPISDEVRTRGRLLYPGFDWTNATHLCLLCRTYINQGIVYKNVKKLSKLHQDCKSKKRPLSSDENSGSEEPGRKQLGTGQQTIEIPGPSSRAYARDADNPAVAPIARSASENENLLLKTSMQSAHTADINKESTMTSLPAVPPPDSTRTPYPNLGPEAATSSIYPNLSPPLATNPVYSSLSVEGAELELHFPSAPPEDSLSLASHASAGFHTPTGSGVGSNSNEGSNGEDTGSSATSEKEEIDLNKTLEAADISPARPSDKTKKKCFSGKVPKAQGKCTKKIKRFSKGEVDPSPEVSKKRPCVFCKTLLQELAQKFKIRKNREEKYKILSSIPKRYSIGEVMQATGCTRYEAEQASKLKNEKGAYSCFPPRVGVRTVPQSTIDLVVKFYSDPSNSRVSARSGDCIKMRNEQGIKADVEKMRILHNLNDLYHDFVNKYPEAKISISKFALLRPKNFVWPGHSHYHNVCVCEIHQNFEFMLDALGEERKLEEIIQNVTCGNDECFLGLCAECPKYHEVNKILGNVENEDDITYMQWVKTDSTELKQVTVTTSEFAELFQSYIPKIVEHQHITHQQNCFIAKLKNNTLKEEAAIAITVDFAQNYSFVVQNSVQGFHWTNQQATVHPFVVHYWDLDKNELCYKTYCVISDILTHDATTFHLFRTEVLKMVKADFKELAIGKVYYISDGASSQYKNSKNMANLMEHQSDYDLAAEWVFTSTSHGKSTCDAISAVCKCHTRRASLKGKYITTAKLMFDHCLEKLSSPRLVFVLITKNDLTDEMVSALEARYKKYETLTGIRKHHMFQPRGDKIRMCRTANSNAFIDFDFKSPEITTFTQANVEIGKFYSFYEGNNYQIGMLVNRDLAEGDAIFQAVKINRRQNVMSWPEPFLFLNVPYRQILCPVSDIVVDIRFPLGDKFTFRDEDDSNLVKRTCKLYRQQKLQA